MATILIVDDSALSRRILRSILEPGGHTVLEAANGLAALKQYVLHRPDLVLLDLLMQEMPGLEVLAKLREVDPWARVIVATADIQDSTRALVLEAGACGFVSKPMESGRVLAAVQAALAAPEDKP
ncbi:MAG: response regulator [Proteobacteria bacterium]|nr:response regulator [Pseudomonadota bacterium]MBU4356817.1 response regulator [Pseudomonadota bacterium]MBU4448508.1 response regulator [Pseudomonadota bacterium]MCG2772319.1 response regulator [Desulfobacterales bacterium]